MPGFGPIAADPIAALPQVVVGGGTPGNASPSTATYTWTAQAVTASGGGAASPATATYTWTAQAVSAGGAANASPATASYAWTAQTVQASGAASAAPAAASYSWQAQAPTASGAANAQPGTAAYTWTAQAVSASGGSSSPGNASPGTATYTWTAQAVTASGGAAASPGTASLTWTAQTVQATGAASARPTAASYAWTAQHATASGGGGSTPPTYATVQDGILAALQAQLVAWLDWPAERVLIVDPDKLTFHPHGDQYLWLWPASESPDLPVFLGAGRYDFRETLRVEIGLRTRFGTDELTSDLFWMTDQTLGHGLARHKLWDALINFSPVDGNGNWLALAPVVPGQGGRPRMDDDEFQWGESVLGFEVLYDPALTLPPASGGLP